MRCDQCNQNDATIFITQIVDGQTTKMALCATCGEPFTQAAAAAPEVREYLQGRGFPVSSFVDVFAEVANHDARYTKEAFWFVRDGVDHSVRSHSGFAPRYGSRAARVSTGSGFGAIRFERS